MAGRRIRRFLLCIPIALAAVGLAPVTAPAAVTRTFLNLEILDPIGGAGNVGPAIDFPAGITVAGIRGKVTKATVTLLGYHSSAPDDTDMALVRGKKRVMLMSDTCGTSFLDRDNWTFDDSAQGFLSDNGPCANYQQARFRPSNYLGNAPEPDDMRSSGGPGPPFTNSLSIFNGSSPNGTWNLYLFDDNNDAGLGFETSGWALTLKIQPPTGRRAAALKKCRKKRTAQARAKCRKAAEKLPV